MKDEDRQSYADYLAFYNQFRSPPEVLKQHQATFVRYFKDCRNVLDIGCGRGEFLEMLRDAGIGAAGVDIDTEMVDLCRTRGLQVVEADGVSFLESHAGFDGVFMDQVVEHLQPEYMIRLMELCFDKLLPGGRIVVKTINPLSLATFTDYYLDLTHTTAIHPEAMQYIIHRVGFAEIEVRFFARTPDSKRLAKIDPEGTIGKLDPAFVAVYNRNVDTLNDRIFGSEDYAVIGEKKGDSRPQP